MKKKISNEITCIIIIFFSFMKSNLDGISNVPNSRLNRSQTINFQYEKYFVSSKPCAAYISYCRKQPREQYCFSLTMYLG